MGGKSAKSVVKLENEEKTSFQNWRISETKLILKCDFFFISLNYGNNFCPHVIFHYCLLQKLLFKTVLKCHEKAQNGLDLRYFIVKF